MKDDEIREDDHAWRRIAAAFLRPPAAPSPVETEAFVSKVMGRLEPEPWFSAGLRWLVPAMGFALAASVGFMLLPAGAESLEPAEALLLAAPAPDNLLALNLEE
ncbi:MAG: hypothetical protein HY926_01225 [Elusimicrobia bacterium]|nr:hypothetical protein [Elusimicrobiota bacterium]